MVRAMFVVAAVRLVVEGAMIAAHLAQALALMAERSVLLHLVSMHQRRAQ